MIYIYKSPVLLSGKHCSFVVLFFKATLDHHDRDTNFSRSLNPYYGALNGTTYHNVGLDFGKF